MWPVPAAPAVCPRCRATFGCGVDTGGCWCRDVQLDAVTRDAFAQYYEGCLCPDCLNALSEARPAVPSVRAFLTAQLRRKRRLRAK